MIVVPKPSTDAARRDRRPIVMAVLLAMAIFVLDLATPTGIADPVLYVVLVLIGLWLPERTSALHLAVLASVLTVFGELFGPSGAAPVWIGVVNRVLALLAVWIVGVLVYRKRGADQALAASLRELQDERFALDQAAIVARTDQRGIINYVNDKFCEISRYPREELLGQDHRLLNSGYHGKEFMRDLWTTIARGKVWRGEIRNRAKDGTIYWVDTTIVPFLSEAGKPYQYLAIRADITQRKRQEDELRKAEALARLGEMAAVVAHEVKNPLAGIGGVVQIIRERMPDGPDREVLGEVLERVKALNELLQDLLVFARPKPPKVEQIELVPLLKETAELLRRDPAMAAMEVSVEGPPVELVGDSEQLRRLFQNLVLNGAQAMGRKGALRIVVSAQERFCQVEVADRGPGIAADLRERIFEPFFTTKHRGTGLGLPIAGRIVEAHKGRIRVDDTPGGGATLRVTLPLPSENPPVGGKYPPPSAAG